MTKITGFLALILLFSVKIFASSAGTFFQVYVPPNATNPARIVCIIVTSLSDSNVVRLVDDPMDGDSDDSWTGLLNKGQSYICYIKDGAVNDDINGKMDGDYFLVYSDKPVVVAQSTNSDWQHDWVPADNGTMKGNLFFIYSPFTSVSINDINIFAYADSTYVQLYDISVAPKTTTGISYVNIANGTLVFSKYLNTKQELINVLTNGRDLLLPGKTYMMQSTKPVTIQYGALWQNARDGGGFVPGIKGSTVDSFFYFAIPCDYNKEQELRMVSFTNGAHASLDYLKNGNWSNLGSYSINSLQHADWVNTSNLFCPLFRLTVTAGKVALFEANWIETGSYGTSDLYSYCSSENGDGAGFNYLIYLAPPGDEGNCLDPFSHKTFNQLGTNGQFTHAFIYSNYASNTVRIKDSDGNGAVIDTTILIQEKRYFDFKVGREKFELLRANGKRPYLQITGTQPISVATCNWNDNWMCYSSSSVKREVQINSNQGTPNVITGDTTSFTSVIKNVSGNPMGGTKTEVTLHDGLNVVHSNLHNSSNDFGEGEKTDKPNGEKVVKWHDYPFNNNDSLIVRVVVKIDSMYHDGTPIPNHTNLTGTTSTTGIVNGDTVVSQNTCAAMATNLNSSTFIYKYLAAFEDLKNDNWNDWDVNDFICSVVRTIQANEESQIKKVIFDFEALARGAKYEHHFYHHVKINGSSQVSLEVRDSLGNLIPSLSWGPVTKNGEFTVPIFPSTKQALPPWDTLFTTNTTLSQNGVVKGYTAKLTIVTNPLLNPLSSWSNASADPFIINEKQQTIHIANIAGTAGNTQNIDNSIVHNIALFGYYLELGYKMPYDWKWPLETGLNAIWKSYPKYEGYITSGKTSNLDWYNYPDTTKIWKKRIVPPASFEPAGKVAEAFKRDVSKMVISINDSIGKFFASPKIADIDGDGLLETMIGTLDNTFYVFKSNGQIEPGFPYTAGGMIKSSPAVDMNNGNPRIYFGCDDGKLYCIDKNAQLVSGFPVSTGGSIKSSPVVSDINNDSKNEIVVASGDGKIYVYNSSGQIMSGFPKKIQSSVDAFGYLILMPSPAVVDIDKNGSKEIIAAGYDSTLTIIDALGRVQTGFPVTLDNVIYSSPVVIKNSDGTFKIIVATGGGTVYRISTSGVIESQINLGDGFISSPIPVDINNDGKLEIVIASQSGEIFLLDNSNNLSVIWSHKTAGEIAGSPAIADINDDGFMEIIYGSQNGYEFIFDQSGNMDALAMNEVMPFNSWVISSPAIADINNNGKLDAVFASYDGSIRSFEFAETTVNSKIYWSSFGRDLGNTRLAGDADTIHTITDGLGAVFNYINPVTADNTTFRLEAPPNTDKIDLKIYDLGGEKVIGLSKLNFVQNGIYWEYVWNLKNEKGKIVANGAYIYLVDITVNGKTYSKNSKLAIVR